MLFSGSNSRDGARQPVAGNTAVLLDSSFDRRKAPAMSRAETNGAPNVRQYLYHLNAGVKRMSRAEALSAVIAVTPVEVERVARTVAKLRGRYLARLIDLGSTERDTVTDGEATQLRRAREAYDELERGFAELKSAIESGEIMLDGVRAD